METHETCLTYKKQYKNIRSLKGQFHNIFPLVQSSPPSHPRKQNGLSISLIPTDSKPRYFHRNAKTRVLISKDK